MHPYDPLFSYPSGMQCMLNNMKQVRGWGFEEDSPKTNESGSSAIPYDWITNPIPPFAQIGRAPRVLDGCLRCCSLRTHSSKPRHQRRLIAEVYDSLRRISG